MGTQLYNSKGLAIFPTTDAGSVTLDNNNNVKTKINQLDNTLGSVNSDISNIHSKITELKTSIDNSIGTIPEGLNSSFKSTVFLRSKNRPDKPEGGDYNNPIPEGWSDGVPEGEEIMWASTRVFSSDGKYPQQEEWTTPQQMTDTSTFDCAYSTEIAPKPPTGHRNTNPLWKNESEIENKLDIIWMATSTSNNGVWSDWVVTKIKGEDGEDGTSVSIRGSFDSEELLKQTYPEGPTNASDSYLINGELWVWDGDSWQNVGQIKGEKGEKGDTPYVHIKYANESNEGYYVESLGVTLQFTESSGEVPGNYIGTYVNYVENDEGDISLYKWSKFKGEDGWGYEYVYKLDNTTPSKPSSENKDDYVAEGWSDEPLTPTASKKYCYVCVRLKVGERWEEFSEPVVYTTYVTDGKNSLIMNLLEDSCTVPCYDDGTLISGTHFGSGTEQRFTTSLSLQIYIFYGTTDVTESMSFSLENTEGLNASIDPTGYLEIIGFEGNVRSGRTVITATNDTYGTVSHAFTVTKAYCGKDGKNGTNAEFQYYQVKPFINSITAIYNLSENKFTALTPTSLTLKVESYTQNGRETLSSTPNGITFAIEFRDVNNTTLNLVSNDTGKFDLSTMSVDTAYINAAIVLGEDIIDMERIPVLWKLTGVTAEMPDWVTGWSGETTEIAGNKVLTGKLYAGDAPSQGQTDWKGILIGSNVASVENLPFDEYLNTTRDFSGILAVKNFDTNPGDNVFGTESDKAQVTFALDANTGDAYFKGEVHADKGVFNGTVYATDGEFNGTVYANSGKFTGEIEATSGKFENGTITNSLVSNLVVSNESNDYNVVIGEGTNGENSAVMINSTTIYRRALYTTVILNSPYVLFGEIDSVEQDLVLPESLQNSIVLDFTNPNASLYTTITNSINRDPYYIVKFKEAHPLKGFIEVMYPAEVTNISGIYHVIFNREFIELTPIVKINCDSTGKTGQIQIVDLNNNGGYFSRAIMNGGSFTVEYNSSASFSESTKISSVSVVNDGLLILGIPTIGSGSTHGYNRGILYVDSSGIVRVSDGNHGYIKG